MKKRKILPLLLISTTLFSFISCGVNNDSDTKGSYSYVVDKKEDKDIKGASGTQYASVSIPVSYFNDTKIPYVSLDVIVSFLNQIYDSDLFSIETIGNKQFKITNNLYNETAIINYKAKTITFSDVYLFQNYTKSDKGTIITVLNSTASGKKDPFLKVDSATYNKGTSTTIDLNSYENIALPYINNTGYIPFCTAFDVLFNKLSSKLTIINEQLFVINSSTEIKSNNLTYYGRKYYNAASDVTLSQEELNFNYDETCLMLDYFYGLKDIINVKYYDTFFKENNLKEKMLKSSKDFDTAYKAFVEHYIKDFHSSFQLSSPYSGDFTPEIEENSYLEDYTTQYRALTNLRYNTMNPKKDYSFVIPPYQVVDDTAIITFDQFTMATANAASKDIVDNEYLNNDITYTSRLIAYALDKINDNANIKNVVLDLSCNIGGSLDIGIDVISAFIGYCDLSIKNTTNNSTMTTRYTADSNLDGVINEKDHLKDSINKYVIGSSLSFSCGNYVPCILKQAGVKIIGQTTGGGTCSVSNNISPIGTYYGYSSSYQLCTFKDGIYSHVNDGAKADIEVNDFSSLYDRTSLVNKIHQIQQA